MNTGFAPSKLLMGPMIVISVVAGLGVADVGVGDQPT